MPGTDELVFRILQACRCLRNSFSEAELFVLLSFAPISQEKSLVLNYLSALNGTKYIFAS